MLKVLRNLIIVVMIAIIDLILAIFTDNIDIPVILIFIVIVITSISIKDMFFIIYYKRDLLLSIVKLKNKKSELV